MKIAIRCIALTLAIWAFVLQNCACSSLDPNVGPLRVEQPVASDGGDDAADVDLGECSAVGADDVCFVRNIRPIIDRGGAKDVEPGQGRGCKGCHSRTQASHNGLDLGGLETTTLGTIRKGGGSSGTRIIVPGKPDESVIVQVLRGQYPYAAKMPKGGPAWNAAEIKLMVDWIQQGARGRSEE
jgi:hypothetical protein